MKMRHLEDYGIIPLVPVKTGSLALRNAIKQHSYCLAIETGKVVVASQSDPAPRSSHLNAFYRLTDLFKLVFNIIFHS